MKTVAPAASAAKERRGSFTTISGRPIRQLYTPADIASLDYERDLADPGTLSLHARYSSDWLPRQALDDAAVCRLRHAGRNQQAAKQLLKAGGTGLSVAFDLPTLMGRDPDHELSLGEVGKCGVNITSLADMETLFDGIDLAGITTSMTINSPASMIFAMYLVVAEQQGASWESLSGTIQNDILKEFIAQKEYIYPPRPSMRLITDVFSFCAERVPRWNTISVSGYHIREAGATAAQELAFTLRDGVEYVQYGVDAGLGRRRLRAAAVVLLQLAQRFLRGDREYRAARRIWAHVMRDRFKAKSPSVMAASLPHPDRRRLVDGTAAVQQRRADGAAGAGCGAWRHAVAAHQLAGRGACAADRGSRHAGAADAADHRARDRRDQHRRSARRLVLR